MRFRTGLAIDLGTVNSLIFLRGRGVVVDEPSAIALQRPTGKAAAAGEKADALAGKEPVDIEIVHPLRDGVISDLDAATYMLQAFLRRAHFHRGLLRPLAVMCVPSGAGFVERQAIIAAITHGRPRLAVRLVDEPVAAAIGAGVDPSGSQGALVVDVGGGTTEAALVVGAHMVRARSLRIGGNAMDEAIAHMLKTEFGLLVGRRAAERLKITLGLTGGESGYAEVAGIDVAEGMLREQRVTGELVASALEHAVATIIESVEQLLSEMPPDLADDVVERKIQLAGGGALLLGLSAKLETATGVETVIVEDPLRSVVRGAAAILRHPQQIELSRSVP
jgi:rod shape-determining protein MreB and related proteins